MSGRFSVRTCNRAENFDMSGDRPRYVTKAPSTRGEGYLAELHSLFEVA